MVKLFSRNSHSSPYRPTPLSRLPIGYYNKFWDVILWTLLVIIFLKTNITFPLGRFLTFMHIILGLFYFLALWQGMAWYEGKILKYGEQSSIIFFAPLFESLNAFGGRCTPVGLGYVNFKIWQRRKDKTFQQNQDSQVMSKILGLTISVLIFMIGAVGLIYVICAPAGPYAVLIILQMLAYYVIPATCFLLVNNLRYLDGRFAQLSQIQWCCFKAMVGLWAVIVVVMCLHFIFKF